MPDSDTYDLVKKADGTYPTTADFGDACERITRALVDMPYGAYSHGSDIRIREGNHDHIEIDTYLHRIATAVEHLNRTMHRVASAHDILKADLVKANEVTDAIKVLGRVLDNMRDDAR